MIEIVIDGTNFGGKTPLVERLLARLEADGWVTYTASPYRDIEVYDLWDQAPEEAARRIVARMEEHRSKARACEIMVWDRGWPTCFVSTKNTVARRLFLPLPKLTYLLLNTAEATAKKVRKYGLSPEVYPWMYGHKLRDAISYEELAKIFADNLRAFRPTLEDDRFDLDLVAAEILAEVNAEKA